MVAGESRRRPYGFLVFAMAGIAALVALGNWQLDRLATKRALIAERRAALAQPPLDLARLPGGAGVTAYRRVTVTGRFLHEKELLIGPRPRDGRAGWHVVTPLERADGGIVLVDRGWVPNEMKDPRTRAVGQIGGAVRLIGFLRSAGRRGSFVPDNDPVKDEWHWIDPAAMAAHLGLDRVAPYWIARARDGQQEAGPVGVDRVAMPPNNHLGYAVTWYALAFSLGVLAIIYWRRSVPRG